MNMAVTGRCGTPAPAPASPHPPRKRAGDDRFLANSDRKYLVDLEGRTLIYTFLKFIN